VRRDRHSQPHRPRDRYSQSPDPTPSGLEEGTLSVNATLIRLTGVGLVRKLKPKSTAGEREMDLPAWCVEILRARAAVGVAADEPVFGTVDGTFRDPRNVHRWLRAVRARVGLDWVTPHSWRKTSATVLDDGGATARMIADRLGHSRVSMTQDVYLGRRHRPLRVVSALEAVDPRPRQSNESEGKSAGTGGGGAA
jgi:integrase